MKNHKPRIRSFDYIEFRPNHFGSLLEERVDRILLKVDNIQQICESKEAGFVNIDNWTTQFNYDRLVQLIATREVVEELTPKGTPKNFKYKNILVLNGPSYR